MFRNPAAKRDKGGATPGIRKNRSNSPSNTEANSPDNKNNRNRTPSPVNHGSPAGGRKYERRGSKDSMKVDNRKVGFGLKQSLSDGSEGGAQHVSIRNNHKESQANQENASANIAQFKRYISVLIGSLTGKNQKELGLNSKARRSKDHSRLNLKDSDILDISCNACRLVESMNCKLKKVMKKKGLYTDHDNMYMLSELSEATQLLGLAQSCLLYLEMTHKETVHVKENTHPVGISPTNIDVVLERELDNSHADHTLKEAFVLSSWKTKCETFRLPGDNKPQALTVPEMGVHWEGGTERRTPKVSSQTFLESIVNQYQSAPVFVAQKVNQKSRGYYVPRKQVDWEIPNGVICTEYTIRKHRRAVQKQGTMNSAVAPHMSAYM